MANTIIIKNSSTVSDVPTAGQLEQGELALNLLDEKLYSKNSSDAIFEIAGAGLTDIVLDLSPQLGGDLQSNAFNIDMADDDSIFFGAGNDAEFWSDGADMWLRTGATADFNIISAAETMATFAAGGAVSLYYNNAISMRTQDSAGTGNTSRVEILDIGGTYRNIGFNEMPIYEIDVADTFDRQHAGFLWHKDSGGAISFTADNDATIPAGAMWMVHNDDTEDLTIAQGTGVTISWLTAGGAPVDGDVTVEQGGIVTVFKYTATVYWAWGSKAAAGAGVSALDELSDVTLTSLADDNIMIYDTGTALWRNYSMTGDIDLNDVGVTTATVSTITGKTALTSGLVSTDELLVSDGGTLKRMDISVIEAYMEANLTGFGTVTGTGTNNYIAVWNGTTGIDADVSTFDIAFAVNKSAPESITGAWEWQDSASIRFGTDNDARVFFNSATSDLRWDLNDTINWRVFGGTSGTEAMFHALSNGEFGAYYNGNLKLTTTNTGVNVTGTAVATVGFSGPGSLLTGLTAANISGGSLGSTVLPYTTQSTAASNYKIPFLNTTAGTSGNFGLLMDSGASPTYNPSTNVFTATNLAGSGVNITALAAANISAGNLATGVNLYIAASSPNISCRILLQNSASDVSGNFDIIKDGGGQLSYNPSTNIFTAGTFNGSGANLVGIPETAISDGALLARNAGTETISGAWTFSGLATFSHASSIVSGNLEFQDNSELRFGTDNDVQLFHNGIALELDLGTDLFYIREGVTNIAIFSPSSGCSLYDSVGTLELRTQTRTTTGNTSGAGVYAHTGTEHDVGFNVLPTFNMNASDTLEASHCGHLTGKDNTTTTYTLTGPTSSNVDFPVGGVCNVVNLGATGNYTINDTGTCTMYYMDGAAAPVDIALAGTLAPGGWISLYRYSTTAIYITGTGFTP